MLLLRKFFAVQCHRIPSLRAGPCRFALEEAVLALARLTQRFSFSLDPEHHSGPLDLISGITISPKGGIWLRVQPRSG